MCNSNRSIGNIELFLNDKLLGKKPTLLLTAPEDVEYALGNLTSDEWPDKPTHTILTAGINIVL